MTQLPSMIRQRRCEHPLLRPPPIKYHPTSRHFLILIVSLQLPSRCRLIGCVCVILSEVVLRVLLDPSIAMSADVDDLTWTKHGRNSSPRASAGLKGAIRDNRTLCNEPSKHEVCSDANPAVCLQHLHNRHPRQNDAHRRNCAGNEPLNERECAQ